MQENKEMLYPNCLCCGEHIDKKHSILDALFQCPKCRNEHYFMYPYDADLIGLLSDADELRNSHHYQEAYIAYESISKKYPTLIDPYWGLFLSTYGVVYLEEHKKSRYLPAIHQFHDELPSHHKHYLKVIDLASDKYIKNHYFKACEEITKTWTSAKATIKKVKPIKVKEPDLVIPSPIQKVEEIIADGHPIGKDLKNSYIIDPIIDNKIKSAEQIYLNTKKYGRALKIFEEVLSIDPLAQRAWWDKILCMLEVLSLDDLKASAQLDLIFVTFEKLMGCFDPKDENIYLQAIERHFFKKLSEVTLFDQALFDFITSWKKGGEQHLFFDMIYQEITKKLNSVGITSVDFIHQALASSTKHIPKQDLRWMSKYVDIAYKVNQLGFYKDSLVLTNLILSENPNHIAAILIQLCATYKVADMAHLHTALKDMKFVKTLKHLLSQSYRVDEFFIEIKKAIVLHIEQENYKLALQMIDAYVEMLPSDEKDVLYDALLTFSNHLIYQRKFNEAKKYINLLIEKDDKIPAAHWAKYMIFLKAHTHFEVLMTHPKKDLMKFSDFERALNCHSDHQAYIQFYKIQDRLKQPTEQNIMFRKMTRKNFDYFDQQCSVESLNHFVHVIFPRIENETPKLFSSHQLSTFNVFNRSVLIIFLIAFSLVLSNLKILFDPLVSNDPLIVSNNIFLLFRNTLIYILVPGLVILYTLIWVKEKENIKKGLIGGILYGLIASIVSLIFLGAIPFVLTRYVMSTLFGLSPYIIPGVLFFLTIVASFFILRTAHLRLVNQSVDKKFIRLSYINITILSLILIAGLVMTYLFSIN